MRNFYNSYIYVVLLVVAVLMTAGTVSGQSALATNSGVTEDSTYRINVTGLQSDSTYTFVVNGVTDTTGVTGVTTQLLTSIMNFEDGLGYDSVIIIKTNGTPDTTIQVLHEILITDADHDGDFDYSEASCDYSNPSEDRGTIVATVAPYNGDNVYMYVLADTSGMVDGSALSYNYTGHFTGLANGDYAVYAYNFLDTMDARVFRDSLENLGNFDLDDFNAVGAPFCFNSCGDHDYTVDCECPLYIDTQPDSLLVCEFEDVMFTASTSTSLATSVAQLPTPNEITYQWQVDSTGTFLDMADDTLSTLSLESVTYAMDSNEYRLIATLNVGGQAICSDTSDIALLEVIAQPELLTTLDTMVCSDEVVGVVLGISNDTEVDADSLEYNIVSITGNGLTPGASNASEGTTSDANYISSDTWLNTRDTAVNVIYSVAPIHRYCSGDTIDITVMIKPQPVFKDTTIIVCSDEIVGLNLMAIMESVRPDSFVVSDITADIGLVAGDTNYVASMNVVDSSAIVGDTWTNRESDTLDVVYTVRGISMMSCDGAADTIRVRVLPEPVIADTIETTVCSDDEISVTLPTMTDNSLTIDSFYLVSADATGLTADAGNANTGQYYTSTSALASDKYTNSSGMRDTVTYALVPYTGQACTGDTLIIQVEITPGPVGMDDEIVVCSDSSLIFDLNDLITNGMTDVVFEWSAAVNDSVTGETTTSTTSDTIADVLTNVTADVDTVVYTVYTTGSATDGDCIGDTLEVLVIVRPEPVYTGETLMACSGETFNIDLSDNKTGSGIDASSFSYSATSGGSPFDSGTSTGTISDSETNMSASDVMVEYTITPISADGCEGDDFTVTVTIKPEPVLDAMLSDTVCSDAPIGITLDDSLGIADSFIIVSVNVGSGLDTLSLTDPGKVGPSGIANDAFGNSTAAPITVVYTIIPVSADDCEGAAATVTATIDPEATVEAGATQQLCSNSNLTLADLGASISGPVSDGTWSTSGDGTFLDASSGADASYSGAVVYIPGTSDKGAGTITLTLTSADPSGDCGTVSDTVIITIDDVECSTFPWDGNE